MKGRHRHNTATLAPWSLLRFLCGAYNAEISLDLGLAVLTNIVAQYLVYAPTVAQSTSFAVVILGLAYLRRLWTRHVFATFILEDRPQTRRQSGLEVGVDTALAFMVGVGLQLVWYGAAVTWAKAGGLTLVVYTVTLIRRYLLRRIFVWWARDESGCTALMVENSRPRQRRTMERLP